MFAVESGSRTWGFASANSDYDVRFVYWKPLETYLEINLQRDVIEKMGDDDLDFAGWDLRKTLQLAYKSNPSLHDWLATPDFYFRHEVLYPELKSLCLDYFDPNTGYHHFRSMAKTNFENYRSTPSIPFKKYFYVFRPLLCAKYIERYLKPAPCKFQDLLDEFYPKGEVRDQIELLLEQKRKGLEVQKTKQNPILHKEIERIFSDAGNQPSKRERMQPDALSDFFRRVVSG